MIHKAGPSVKKNVSINALNWMEDKISDTIAAAGAATERMSLMQMNPQADMS